MIDYNKTMAELVEKFGPVQGMHINAVVLPNIEKDFRSMLESAPSFAKVKEEYIFDEKIGKITLEGSNRKITAVVVEKY